jgi:hypothetical protein
MGGPRHAGACLGCSFHARRLLQVRGTIHELLAPISTEQLWRKPYACGNSIGHLLLHLTGNLNHYIGAQIAKTGYVRNRPLEFSDASKRAERAGPR